MLSVEPTRYDVRFSFFRIPVRVHPAFWIVALLLGYQTGDMRLTAIWVALLFFSIFVHELGHALVARYFGWPPQIVLYHFGGLAIFQPTWGYTRKRSILISLAGPGAGFLLYGLVVAIKYGLIEAHHNGEEWATQLYFGQDEYETGTHFAITRLEWINLYWGLLNLLPVHPLDGGQVCSELYNARSSFAGLKRTHQMGMIAGACASLYFITEGRTYAGLMFAGLAFVNYQKYEQLSKPRY